jgi:hypothetical protein
MQDNPPVTVDVIQSVKPGKEQEFETLLAQFIDAASQFEGYLGASVFRPNEPDERDYRVIFKFDRLEHLKQWEHSTTRQRLLTRAKELTVDDGTFSIITGLETWFTLPARPGMKPPPRYKMVIVSGIAILVINQVLAVLPTFWLEPIPSLIRSLISIFATTTLMTYVVMPRLTKLLAGWLYPSL